MTEIDKLIARLGFQLVQYELALAEAQRRVAQLEQQINELTAPVYRVEPTPLVNPEE